MEQIVLKSTSMETNWPLVENWNHKYLVGFWVVTGLHNSKMTWEIFWVFLGTKETTGMFATTTTAKAATTSLRHLIAYSSSFSSSPLLSFHAVATVARSSLVSTPCDVRGLHGVKTESTACGALQSKSISHLRAGVGFAAANVPSSLPLLLSSFVRSFSSANHDDKEKTPHEHGHHRSTKPLPHPPTEATSTHAEEQHPKSLHRQPHPVPHQQQHQHQHHHHGGAHGAKHQIAHRAKEKIGMKLAEKIATKVGSHTQTKGSLLLSDVDPPSMRCRDYRGCWKWRRE